MEHQNDSNTSRPKGIWASWSGLEILGLFFLTLTGNFFFQIVVFSAVDNLFVSVAGGGILGVFLPLTLLGKMRQLKIQRDFFLDIPDWRVLAASGLLAVCTLIPTSLLAELSLRLVPADPDSMSFMNDHLPTTPVDIGLAVLAVVFIGPLAEELIFRGILHRLASGIWGPVAASVVSSLVFAILHGEAWILLGLVGVGLVLAFVFEATGSVTACWVTHAVHNAISLTMMIRQGPVAMEPQPLETATVLWGMGSLIVVVFLGRFLLQVRAMRLKVDHLP